VRLGWGTAWKERSELIKVRTSPPFWFPAGDGPGEWGGSDQLGGEWNPGAGGACPP